MNIEAWIPKETVHRDDYIKNILWNQFPIGIGLDQINITFNFKTNKDLYKGSNRIRYKDMILVSFDEINWVIMTNDMRIFLPKEYLIETWEVL